MQRHYSILKIKKIKMDMLQLEHDYFLQKNGLLIAPQPEARAKQRAIRYQRLKQLRNISYINNKLCYQGLGSANCRRCSHGDMVCFHLTSHCTRNCFFCPQKRTEAAITGSALTNYSPAEDKELLPVQQAIEWFDAKGCGLTGGEPLVVIDKLLHYIKLLKNRFGSYFWIHLYTNGDLLTAENLKALQKTGLDEIRFNLAANGYNVDPVALAKQYIPKVMVEIPVIPEAAPKIKQTMQDLEQLGIAGINLHELTINQGNISKVKGRKYKIRKDYKFPFYIVKEAPVYQSEETIFDLMEFAVEQNFAYSVHHCTFSQRLFGQRFSRYYKTAIKYRRPYETITGQGLLEKLVVPAPGLEEALEDLEKNRVPKAQIHVSGKKQQLETHRNNLIFLNPAGYEVRIIRCIPDENFSEVYIGNQVANPDYS